MPARAIERSQCSAPLRVIPRTGSGTFLYTLWLIIFEKESINFHDSAGHRLWRTRIFI